MATQSELAQIQHILGKRRNLDQNVLDLSARKKSREYLDSHKDVEKRRRDRINTCLDTIRTLVPLCHQLPRHRRVDKADLLDLAIIYLRMVNQFLEKLGVNDIFSAAHQQVSLFSSLEKWVKDQAENSPDVPSFARDILAYVECEVETASHVIASQQTAGNTTPGSENGFQQKSEWMKMEQSGLDDDSSDSGPRSSSCMTSSGSDEERSQGSSSSSRERGSEDSMSVVSPSNFGVRLDYPRNRSSSIDEVDGSFQSYGRHNVTFDRSSNGRKYSSLICQNVSKVECVDKAINTDATSANFSWPPDSTFTLPIMSGKLVLHTPMSLNGTNNLNAPVTLHAEIHSSPFQTQSVAAQNGATHPKHVSNGRGCDTKSSDITASEITASTTDFKCSSPRIPRAKVRDTSPFVHKSSFENGMPVRDVPCSSTKHPQDISVPAQIIHVDRPCSQPERQNASMNSENTCCYDDPEVKSYTPLLPVRRSIEERNTRYPTSQNNQSQMIFSGSEETDGISTREENNRPYFKRYSEALSQARDRDDHNSHVRNKPCSCCTNIPSSLKLKSLMVHRHQTQHIMMSR